MTKTKIEWDELVYGNRIITTGGYAIVYCPNHPRAKPNGYVFEHRLIFENLLKRFLNSGEYIHHKNGKPSDNRIENLELFQASEHSKLHISRFTKDQLCERAKGLIAYAKSRRFERKEIECACGCGKKFVTPDPKGRYHNYIVGHNNRGKNWRWNNGHI